MEGGSPFFEYLTYGVVAIVLGAMLFLLLRTVWFFLSLLAIPLTQVASRWPPAERMLVRWGDRGARRDPTTWRHAPLQSTGAPLVATTGSPPRSVSRGALVGAVLGALPGVWLAMRGALHARATGGSAGEIAAAVGMGLGLVAAAGVLAGAAVGVLAGLAWNALRRDG
jgi:hypothetical protein